MPPDSLFSRRSHWSDRARWAPAGLLLAFTSGAALPATFTVDSAQDAGDALPGDGQCESPAGSCTLRAAVQEANALQGTDRILLPPGNFVLSIPGSMDDAALTGDLDLLDDVTLTGAGADRSVIDAAGLDRVLHVPLATVGVELSGVTLRGGFAEFGGGIVNLGSLSLDGVVVRECHGVVIFGGIINFGSFTAVNSAIVENTTLGNGGGIANDGGTMLLLDSEVSRNRAEADAGGFGGPGAHTLVRTRVTDNFAGVLGGGMATPPGGSLLLIESSIERNNGLQGGGLASGGTAVIESSTIADNVARAGGGGIGATGQRLHISNSTISGNTATGDGGGIAQTVADFMLRNVTIANNVTATGNGGGLSNKTPSGRIANTILAGNMDQGGEAPDCSGTLESRGYNLISNGTGCTVNGDGDGNQIGVAAGLGPLADNGGPTRTHLPSPQSPVIDAGNPAPPESDDASCLARDQRGISRPQDGDGDGLAICDIGAVEVGPATAAFTVAGGGWLETRDGGKITFNVVVRRSGDSAIGMLSLADTAAEVRLQIDTVDAIGAVAEPCGTIAAGPRALQFTGTGRFNDEPAARFRACVDGSETGGRGTGPRGMLWLECLSGCTYTTGARVRDDAIDGGRVEFRRSD